ncbi:hypothetical protein [Polaribacter atrinae]|uniref:Uncharacterized protein n=1 Tax=Polaribacter atrinae TaxID=1333662 RepID=A0A176T0J2_9FLAO|nr:hypothetical protein [Polaribacter atrinae]OAD40926.1 hypothetical protein LPB303_15550 [Polaribacter atrinae]
MCEIDWNLLFDFIKSLSIILASGVAIYGINSWRRETKWKRKYELAEETLSLFYEVQDAISIIRSPFGNTNEGKTRKRNENERKEDSEILDQAFVVIERFENNKEPFYKLRALKYRFITIFGKESEEYFNDIVKLTNRIMTVSGFLGRRYWKDQGRRKFTDQQFEKHLKKMEEYEAIIWEDYGENNGDEIKEKIEQIISGIEKVCNSVLRKK